MTLSRQHDLMHKLFRTLGDDQDAVCQTYVEAERDGRIAWPHGAAGMVPANRAAPMSATPSDIGDAVIPVVKETITVTKRRRTTGRVRLSTRTEVIDAVAAVDLDRYRVEVTRVPVGQIVDEAPSVRAEGDTTVVPVLEERLVVVKQLVLVEELRIRHLVDRRSVREPVKLRRQRAIVERLDAMGKTIPAETA